MVVSGNRYRPIEGMLREGEEQGVGGHQVDIKPLLGRISQGLLEHSPGGI